MSFVPRQRVYTTCDLDWVHGVYCCREPLSGLPVTPANIRYAERLRAEIQGKIERGTFNYADHFPHSSKLKIFGNATTSAFSIPLVRMCTLFAGKKGRDSAH